MPRSRKALSDSKDLVVEVQVNGVWLPIVCKDKSLPVSWLASQAAAAYAARSRGTSSLLEGTSPFIIQYLRSPTGVLLPMSSPVSDAIGKGEQLTAEIAFPESSPVDNYNLELRGNTAFNEAVMSYDSGLSMEAYGHNARVFSLAFSPIDDKLVASASDDGTAKVWRLVPGAKQHRQAASFHGHTDSVMCVSWDPSGNLVATGSADTTVQVWKPGLRDERAQESSQAAYGVKSIAKLQGHPEEVYASDFLEGGSGERMLTASAWRPFLWDLETQTRLADGDTISAPDEGSSGSMPERWQDAHIFSARQMPGGGPLVAAACSDGAVRFWSMGSAHSSLSPHAVSRVHSKGMGSACAWDCEGNTLACVSTDGTVAVLDIRMGGRICWAADVGRPLYSCLFLPTPSHLLACCGKGSNVTFLHTASSPPSGPATSLLNFPDTPLVIHNSTIRWQRIATEAAPQPHRSSMDTSSAAASAAQVHRLSLDDDRVAAAAATAPAVSIHSRSPVMSNRSLLCLAASSDGASLAASGDTAILEGASRVAWASHPEGSAAASKAGHHQQSKRSAIEVWQRHS